MTGFDIGKHVFGDDIDKVFTACVDSYYGDGGVDNIFQNALRGKLSDEEIRRRTALVNDITKRIYVNASVWLGYLVANYLPNFFVEVAAGPAVTTFTLAKLGCRWGVAYDNNPDFNRVVQSLASDLELDIAYGTHDFYKLMEEDIVLPRDTFIIADKPSGDYSGNLEWDIIKYAIEKKCHLALVPTFVFADDHDFMESLSREYEKPLAANGYDVNAFWLNEDVVPLRMIIAINRENDLRGNSRTEQW